MSSAPRTARPAVGSSLRSSTFRGCGPPGPHLAKPVGHERRRPRSLCQPRAAEHLRRSGGDERLDRRSGSLRSRAVGHEPPPRQLPTAFARVAASRAAIRGVPAAADHAGKMPMLPPPREVKLAGSVLKINEYPIFPRCDRISRREAGLPQAVGLQHHLAATDAVAGLSLRSPAAWPVAGLSAAGTARRPARRPRSGRSSSPCSFGTWGTD